MQRKVKQKPAPKGKGARERPANSLAKHGMDAGRNKLREQAKDAVGRTDSPEEYGSEQLEHGEQYLTGKAEQVIHTAAGQVKERIAGQAHSYHADTSESHAPDAENAEQQPVIRQKPTVDADHAVKTKESYVADHTEQPSRRVDMRRNVHHESPVHADEHTQQTIYVRERGRDHAKVRALRNQSARVESRMDSPNIHIVPECDIKAASTKSVKTASKAVVKSTAKGTVKSAQVTVKTAERSVKTAEQSARMAARTAKFSAQAAQRAAQAAKTAAQTAVKTAKVAAQTVIKVIRALIAAAKELIAAIAAGGWVAVAVIAGIALVGLLLCTGFGVFMADETEDGSKPMTEAVTQIDAEFRAEMDARIADLTIGDYDEVSVDYMGDIDGDSAYVNNWNDVLATYAVLLTTDETNAMDAITVTPEKVQKLRQIFYEMNEVEYDSEIIEEEIPPDPNAPQSTPAPGEEPEEPATKRVLHINVTVKSMNYKEAADRYRMNEKQREVLDEMMSAEFAMLFAELVGVDVLGGADLTQIISGLPASGKGAEVVKAALTKLGAPYVWGAKGESKFDCSGLAYWSIKQVDASLGDRMYTNAAGQAKYCYDRGLTVGESELQPGDLVFWQNLKCKGCHRWQEVHHVGICIGSGKVCEASSGKGRVVIRDLWSTTNYPIYMFGRPY